MLKECQGSGHRYHFHPRLSLVLFGSPTGTWAEQGMERRVGDTGAGPGVSPSDTERGICGLALRSGERQRMLWANVTVGAQPEDWEGTHREALGGDWGHLPSSAERSPPLWALSSAAEEQQRQRQELESETARRGRRKIKGEKRRKAGLKSWEKGRERGEAACWE